MRECTEDKIDELVHTTVVRHYAYGNKIQSGVIVQCTRHFVFQKYEVSDREFTKYQHAVLKYVDQNHKNCSQSTEGQDTKNDEKGEWKGLRLMNLDDIMKQKFPSWVFFKNNSFYFFRKPKFKLGANYKLQCDYNFEYERCNTQDKFTDWVQHLNSKNWVHKQMLNQFMKLADKAHKEKTGDNLIGWGTM